MDCRESLIRLHAYLDRELSIVEISEVERHLDNCPPCHDHFVFEGKVLRLIRERARDECCPDHVRLRILRALRVTSDR